MPSAVARLWITSRMSARSKFSTMASSSPSGRADSGGGPGSVRAGGFCAHADGPASTAATLTIASILCPFTASSSLLRKGSGLVGTQGEYPLHAPYLLARANSRHPAPNPPPPAHSPPAPAASRNPPRALPQLRAEPVPVGAAKPAHLAEPHTRF